MTEPSDKELAKMLQECADEVESFPHPSHCDHLHIAHKLMRQAAARLEAREEAQGDYDRLRGLIEKRIADMVIPSARGSRSIAAQAAQSELSDLLAAFDAGEPAAAARPK